MDGCDHDFGVGPPPSPCVHDFTGRAVTGQTPWRLMSDGRVGAADSAVPTCRHCGLSQAMHDYLARRGRAGKGGAA